MKKYVLGGIIALLAMDTAAYASELPVDYRSIKAQAMGGASTASPNDMSGVLLNPAGLTLTRNPRNRKGVQNVALPFPGEIGANEQMLAHISADPDLWSKDLFESAQNNPGDQSYLEVQMFPAATFRAGSLSTLMLGAPIRSETRVAFVEGNVDTAYVKAQNTASFAMTAATQTDRGLFRGGVTLRPNYRLSYETDSYAAEGNIRTKDFIKQMQSEGIGSSAVAMDVGMMLTLPDEWFPTLAVAVRNLPTGCIDDYENPITHEQEKMCGAIRSGGKAGDPNEARIDPTEVRAGVSLTPRLRVGHHILNIRVSADVYPLPVQIDGDKYGIDHVATENIVHVGTEVFFGGSLKQQGLAVRGGWTEGMLSWGGNLALGALNLSYASYGVSDSLPQPDGTYRDFMERRHMFGVSLLF